MPEDPLVYQSESLVDWNDVRKFLPPYKKIVLMSDGDAVFVGYRAYTDAEGEHWVIEPGPNYTSDEDEEFRDVVLWMYIPEPPAYVEDPSNAN